MAHYSDHRGSLFKDEDPSSRWVFDVMRCSTRELPSVSLTGSQAPRAALTPLRPESHCSLKVWGAEPRKHLSRRYQGDGKQVRASLDRVARGLPSPKKGPRHLEATGANQVFGISPPTHH